MRRGEFVMECGDVWAWSASQPRKLDRLRVKVNDVKARDIGKDQLHHPLVMMPSHLVVLCQIQRVWTDTNQLRRRFRIAAGKQRNLMSLGHQLLSQIRHNPLDAAIEFWRHTKTKGCNLRDSHDHR